MHRLKTLVALAATLTAGTSAVIAVAPPASAYTYTGCRWRSGTVTYVNQDSSNYSGPADSAASDWNAATKAGVHLGRVATGGNFTTNDLNLGNTNYDGITYSSCTGGYYTSGDTEVIVNTYYTSPSANGYTASPRKSLFGHEMGHVFGLNHSDDGTVPACAATKLMFRSSDHRIFECHIYSPRTDDINGVNSLY